MSPKPRSERPSIPGRRSRRPSRASAFVNLSALERWLTGAPPAARNTAELPVTQPDETEDDEEPKTERGARIRTWQSLLLAS
ncbi:MAG: hypothetical protein ACOX6T_03885 [Myxococcales bacterium]|jgi:hypothetical protein